MSSPPPTGARNGGAGSNGISPKDFDWSKEFRTFGETVSRLSSAVGDSGFQKSGRFSLGIFEFVTLGLSKKLEKGPVSDDFIRQKVAAIQTLPQTDQYTGVGIRGTQRFSMFVIPLAEQHFEV
jgi:hypothetical protein